jgi:ABC-type transport system substrate-binding protein
MGYCDQNFDKMVDQQSMEADPTKRKKLVWGIDHKLQEDMARPIIYHLRAATCWQPEVKGLTMMTNSQYNGWRFEKRGWLASTLVVEFSGGSAVSDCGAVEVAIGPVG